MRVKLSFPQRFVFMRFVDRLTKSIYDFSDGRFGERQLFFTMLLLDTVGRKSGQTRTHTLLYIRDGDRFIICGSNFGGEKNPSWYWNLKEHPEATVRAGRNHFTVTASEATGEERERLWGKLCRTWPSFKSYSRWTTRHLPVIILTPQSLNQPTVPQESDGVATRRRFGMPNYVFDPMVLDTIAKRHLGKPLEQMFSDLATEISERYPGAIDDSQPWIFNNAGGVMLEMKLFHASTREYIMIWGTPIGSEGHTGRHLAEFHDTVLDGEAWYYTEGQLTRDVHKPGDYVFVGKGQSSGMHYPDHVWMLEYARGNLPSIVPFGLADALFSTLDYKTAWNTIKIYVKLLMRSMPATQKMTVGALVGASVLLSTLGWTRRHRKVRA